MGSKSMACGYWGRKKLLNVRWQAVFTAIVFVQSWIGGVEALAGTDNQHVAEVSHGQGSSGGNGLDQRISLIVEDIPLLAGNEALAETSVVSGEGQVGAESCQLGRLQDVLAAAVEAVAAQSVFGGRSTPSETYARDGAFGVTQLGHENGHGHGNGLGL
ncbi:MAG: hypothetical protein HY711_11715, partial [Candidatus Melainabacteria bacterium]|nr:hypothetical protein [Candidatus Melainabacteria bacterium]